MARAEVRKQDLASEIAAIVGSSNMDASRVNGKTADASETAVIQCGALRCGAVRWRCDGRALQWLGNQRPHNCMT